MTFDIVVLDTTPLGLLVRSPNLAAARKMQEDVVYLREQGKRIFVPAIADYELRRELKRLNQTESLARLNAFINEEMDRFLPITTSVLRLAADLWAQARQQGKPTADSHALDGDVILCAQALTAFPNGDFVVATSNIGCSTQFVPAALWHEILPASPAVSDSF